MAAYAGLRCQSTGPVVLTAKRPKSNKFPKSLVTIGNHLRARRLELKLLQKDVARLIAVDETTVYNWERGYTKPPLRHMPKILEFLGYDPSPNEPRTIGEKLLKYRRDRGMTQKELARQIGIDPTTLSRLERNKNRCFSSVLKKSSEFFEGATTLSDDTKRRPEHE
ncbi:MAG: helix-turn-helix transcriptional regulator [Bacteroidota bacterium]